MLLKYIVSNYKSIGQPIVFSMVPTAENTDDRFMATLDTKNGPVNILKRGALLGPNASGKSSFIESIDFARDYVVEGQKSGKRTHINQFKGDIRELNGVSAFQFVFYLNGEIYEYGFSVDGQKVHEEWLMLLTKDDFITVFERVTDEQDVTDINLIYADCFNAEEIALIEVLKGSIRDQQKNQLFLYKLYDNGIQLAQNIIGWFQRIQVIFPESTVRGLELKVAQNAELADFLSEMLNILDTGVEKVISKSRKISLMKLLKEMEMPQELIDEIYDKKSGLVRINGKLFSFNDDNGEPVLYELKFKHLLNGDICDFNQEDESDGTQRLLDLLPMLFDLTKQQNIYVIDELDRSLHTLITKEFLKRFIVTEPGIAPQLIMTSHDVNIIDLNLMSQEEIWLVEKNGDGTTKLKPLSNFNIDKDYDAALAYLQGRFGAIPMIRGGNSFGA